MPENPIVPENPVVPENPLVPENPIVSPIDANDKIIKVSINEDTNENGCELFKGTLNKRNNIILVEKRTDFIDDVLDEVIDEVIDEVGLDGVISEVTQDVPEEVVINIGPLDNEDIADAKHI